MGKIVILEGPDGGGKTTLAKELVARGFDYFHDGLPPSGRDNVAYYTWILEQAGKRDKNSVFDRLWLGERIYGPVARGIDTIGDEGQNVMLDLHKKLGVKMFLCLPPFPVVMINYRSKLKDPLDYLQSADLLTEVYHRYYAWGIKNSFSAYLYDYYIRTVDDVIGMVYGTSNRS